MRERLRDALKTAMKAQQKKRISTLRLITASITDRDIAARGSGKERIEESEILDVLAKMIKQRRESVKTYEEAGRAELADQEALEITIIQEFLPKQLSEDEMKTVVGDVVKELGAASLKDMGRTMGELKKRYAGQMDFGKAGAMVRALLG